MISVKADWEILKRNGITAAKVNHGDEENGIHEELVLERKLGNFNPQREMYSFGKGRSEELGGENAIVVH